jgi:uncharacterized protein
MSNVNNGKTCSFDVCATCNITCCIEANPPLTVQREKTIATYLKEQKIPLENAFIHEAYTHPATDAQSRCVFYNTQTRRCNVHAVKPETCRAGPITFDINLKTGKVEWFLKKGTICALAQKLAENKQALQSHFEGAEPELLSLIRELDAESLRAILKIEEPETIKIGETPLPKEILARIEGKSQASQLVR